MDELQLIYQSPTIDAATLKAAGKCIIIAEVLIPIFFGFAIVYDLIMRTAGMLDGDKPNYFSKKELIRLMGIMFVAGPLYLGIFWPLQRISFALSKATSASVADYGANKDSFINKIKEEATKDKKEGSPGEDLNGPPVAGTVPAPEAKAEDDISFSDIFMGVVNIWLFLQNALLSLSSILITVVSIVVKLLAAVLSKVFFAIGPLAVAFSMLPIFKDKFGQWFGVYLNLLCVPITINILDFIFYGSVLEAMKGEGFMNPLMQIALYVAMIVCYCLTFWITSFFVGSSSAGRVLSTATTMATSAIGFLAGGAGGAMASGGSSGGSKGNIFEDAASVANKS